MPVIIHKPTTNGRRNSSVQSFQDVTKKRPEKSLIAPKKKHSGRNNTGHITVRHRGGGVKRYYRIVDFKQQRFDTPATITAIEYDPNRGARIALVEYPDKQKAYILAAEGMKVGMTVTSSKEQIEPSLGARMPLRYIPVGLFVYNIEMTAGKGGQIIRGAGTGAQLQVIEGDYAQLKMPSGEVRLVKKDCLASVGKVSNPDYKLVRYGKAGRMRYLGWKPVVRGKVMNPVDHPHGGGEGRNSIGLKGGPKNVYGKKAMGIKTRKRDNWSNKFILSRRKGKKL